MQGPSGGRGKYSPLREAHGRITSEQAGANAREITDVQVERSGKDAAVSKTVPAVVKRTVSHPPRSAGIQGASSAGYMAPAPGGTQAHALWRNLMTERIAREKAAEAARETDRIPRILRTEKSAIHQASELNAANARIEETQRSEARKANSAGKEQDIEPER